MPSHSRAWILTAAVAVVVTPGCGSPPDPDPAVRPVRYEAVRALSSAGVRRFTGVAVAGTETTLSFRVPGTLVILRARVGDRLGRGALIAELDASDYQLLVKEAEAGLKQAQAQAANAEADLRRVRGLYETNAASRDDYDAAYAQAASTRAQVEALTQRLEMAQRQVAYSRLTAPANGAVAAVRAEVNENVSAGQPIVVLTSAGRPDVEVTVPEGAIARIRSGQEVEVSFDALPGRVLEGQVTEVGVTPGGLATTFPVVVAITSPADGVLPGMAASVAFPASSDGRALIIVPAHAVGEDGEGRFVFVVEPTSDGQGWPGDGPSASERC